MREDIAELAEEARLVMRVSTLKYDLIKAEEALRQFKIRKREKELE